MDSDKKKNITRRKFVKNIAGTALCCACLPLGVLADSARTLENNNEEREKVKMTGTDKEHLAAACGTYCGACPAYINKHCEDKKRFSSGPMKGNYDDFVDFMDQLLCDGCLSGGMLAGHCQKCKIRLCASNKQNDSRCSDCEKLPCTHVTELIDMGDYPHRNEYLPNLEKIREMGVQEWIKYEEERWRCPQCGLPMSWYDAECAGCGEPRSERLFPLSKNKIQSF